MLLRTEHLTKDYGRFRALDDLNLTIAPGEVVGLLGPNGSGKTTALRLLLGFLRPTSGRAWIAGHDCWEDGVAARRHVTYLPGELRLYETMTGRQLVTFLGRLRGRSKKVSGTVSAAETVPDTFFAEVDALARRLDIDLDRPIAELSSGMKRKVALLQVLAPHPPLLLLDEPTNTLDPTMRGELLGLLRGARAAGQAVLFSSHVLAEVEAVCDRVAILQRGRLVHLQAMAELRRGRLVRARFVGPFPGLPAADGFLLREQTGDRVVFEHSGPLADLTRWLDRPTVTELSIEPLGLAPIYHRYHGADA